MISLRRTGAAGLMTAMLALLAAAGCGSSNDGALFNGTGGSGASGGAGGSGGSSATGCSHTPDCGQCQACFDLCTCNGGAVEQCLAQCQTSGTGGQAGGAGMPGTGGTGFGGTGGSGFGGTGGSGFGGTGGSGFGGTGGSGFGGTGGSGFGGAGGSGGSQSCTQGQCPSGGGGFVPGCCASDGTCGYDLQGVCAPKNQPGTPDPGCPPLNFQGYNLPGCCNAAHICGYMDTFLGLGCVDPTGFGQPPQGC